jgi:hypothetical protein
MLDISPVVKKRMLGDHVGNTRRTAIVDAAWWSRGAPAAIASRSGDDSATLPSAFAPVTQASGGGDPP